jgi:glutamine amidotransferase
MPMITLVDYGMGNVRSVAKAFEHLGARVTLTGDPAAIAAAHTIVLPGVGHFGDGMRELRQRGLADPIREAIAAGIPFLGICLGMQLLLNASEEAPEIPGLGVFPGRVVRFPVGTLKIPHMGWNQLRLQCPDSPFLAGLPAEPWCYFVHSYYCQPDDPGLTLATSDYGLDFAAAMGRGKAFATQFHPEKSQDNGLTMLRNFLRVADEAAP